MNPKNFDKFTETDYIVVRMLSRSGLYTHSEISKSLKIPKCKLTRSLQRLEKVNLISIRKKGKFKEYNLNRNKSKEIIDFVAIVQNCNYFLNQKDLCLVRIHDQVLHTQVIAIDWNNFPKEKAKRYQPKNRVCYPLKYEIATVNLNANSDTADINLHPYYVVYDICKRVCPPTDLPLEQVYHFTTFNKFNTIKENLQADSVYLETNYKIVDIHTAILNDPLASIAVKLGYKNKNLDQSVNPVPEYEIQGIESVEQIQSVLNLRKFCIEHKLDELELSKIIENKSLKNIQTTQQ